MPIPKSFTIMDFLALNGQRISSNTNKIAIEAFNDTTFELLSGTGNIYFVKINIEDATGERKIAFCGLFDGTIGDSILITKGRFDFNIPATNFNF